MEEDKQNLAGTRSLKLHTNQEDRPREKAMRLGFEALSDAELMAIVIGSGTPGESVVDLCQRILNDYDQKLNRIIKGGVKGLTKYKGIGPVKAIELMASLELSHRCHMEDVEQKPIRSSADAYHCLCDRMGQLEHEEIWILMLNRAKKVIGAKRMSVGGTTSAVGDVNLRFVGQYARFENRDDNANYGSQTYESKITGDDDGAAPKPVADMSPDGFTPPPPNAEFLAPSSEEKPPF